MLALVIPFAFALTPDGDGLRIVDGPRLPELCMHKLVTGMPCSSCGLGRSFVLAAHGRFAASAAQHRGGTALLGWVVCQAMWRLALMGIGFSTRVAWADLLWSASTFLTVAIAIVALGH